MGRILVEDTLLISNRQWKEEPPRNDYLHFEQGGALITKSQNEMVGKPCIVVKVDNHYEVHRVISIREE